MKLYEKETQAKFEELSKKRIEGAFNQIIPGNSLFFKSTMVFAINRIYCKFEKMKLDLASPSKVFWKFYRKISHVSEKNL